LRPVEVHLFVNIDKFNLEEGIEALQVKLLQLGDIVEDLMLEEVEDVRYYLRL